MFSIRTHRRPPVPVALAALVALVACESPAPTGPAADPGPALGGIGGNSTANILTFADGTVIGEASLTRARNGVTLRAHMEAGPDETFTVWAVVFNNPDACTASPCAPGDIENPDTGANVIRIAGGIAGGAGLHVAGTLREGDASEALIPGAPPLMDAELAEIHFVYRVHGPKLPTEIDDQILTVGGGCATNTCVDVAFSVHLP